MSELAYAQVQAHLARLRLTRVPDCLDPIAEQASKASWSYVEFLDRLLEAEIAARSERDIAMKTKLARFPFAKTLDQFDFAFQPSVDERQVNELATLRFVAQAENLLVLGPPGTGKPHPTRCPTGADRSPG
jgi:DNA replication protein DnaC